APNRDERARWSMGAFRRSRSAFGLARRLLARRAAASRAGEDEEAQRERDARRRAAATGSVRAAPAAELGRGRTACAARSTGAAHAAQRRQHMDHGRDVRRRAGDEAAAWNLQLERLRDLV